MNNMSNTVNMSIRIDKKVKKEADELFKDLGLNMSTAINMFLRQSIREQSIPFEATLNIRGTKFAEALKESEEIIKDKSRVGYSNKEDLIEALDN